MNFLTWKLLILASMANAIGSTITGLALSDEKMERARYKALLRPKVVSGSVSLTISDIIRLVNSVERTASKHRANRDGAKHSSKINKANLRRFINFNARYRLQVTSGRRNTKDMKMFHELQQMVNQYVQ